VKRLDKDAALARVARDRAGASSCAMCSIASGAGLAGARGDGALAGNAHAIAVLDRFAARPGHVLVVLRRHEERLAALARDEHAALHDLGWQLARALDRVLAPRRIYVAALGSATPRATSFPHVHLHVVPLADGGEGDRPAEVFTWANGAYVFDDDAEERALATSLRAALDE
jgi:diadenosine tetraphosphate (Ap4A) HIT family hydrolase